MEEYVNLLMRHVTLSHVTNYLIETMKHETNGTKP